MKLHTQLTAVALLGMAMISSHAYSGTGAGDIYNHTCQSCNQLPQPKMVCSSYDAMSKFCGSEDWIHLGNQDCKQFINLTLYCSNGGTQTFTYEAWSGAGSYCNPGVPNCEQ